MIKVILDFYDEFYWVRLFLGFIGGIIGAYFGLLLGFNSAISGGLFGCLGAICLIGGMVLLSKYANRT